MQRHAEAEITAIWDDDPARGQATSECYGVAWCDDLEGVLSRDDVDTVVVNAPTSQHPEVYRAALGRVKHLFTDNALTIRLADANEIVRLERGSGVRFIISLTSWTRSENLFMRQILDKGLLGQITLMRAHIAHMAALAKWFSGGSTWFADEALAGWRAFRSGLPHDRPDALAHWQAP